MRTAMLSPNFRCRLVSTGSLSIRHPHTLKVPHYRNWVILHAPGVSFVLHHGGSTFPVGHDSIALIPPWIPCEVTASEDIDVRILAVRPVPAPLALTRTVVTGPIVCGASTHLSSILAGLWPPTPELPLWCLRAEATGLLVFSCVLGSYEGVFLTHTRPRTDPRARLSRALDLIERDLGGDLSVARLAAVCEISPDVFSRDFCKVVGERPSDYIRNKRIRKACDLLPSSPLDIAQIARQLGFPNRFHFTRTFSRHVGMPPGRYRRSKVMQPVASA